MARRGRVVGMVLVRLREEGVADDGDLKKMDGAYFFRSATLIVLPMDADEDHEDAAALFEQMLSNLHVSLDSFQDEDRLITDAADAFNLLNDSLLEEEDDDSPIPLAFMNIQLMACKKVVRSLEMVYKRRSLSDWSSFTHAERAADLAHRNNCLSRRSLREWRRSTRHLICCRETALKSLESSRRLLVLRSTVRSWVAVHTRSRFAESLSAIVRRRQTKDALQLLHCHAKLKGLCHLFEMSILRNNVHIWRDSAVQIKLHQQHQHPTLSPSPDIPDSPPPPPPPSSPTPTDDCYPASAPAPAPTPTPPASSPSGEGKENVSDARRNIGQQSRLNAARRKPKLLLDMEKRQAARLERRQQARVRKERELVAKKEAEEKARADQEKKKQLLIEQRRLATDMANLHRTAAMMKRHFHYWKTASVIKNEWDNRKAYVLWSDAVLGRGFSGWRAVTTATQKGRTERAGKHASLPFIIHIVPPDQKSPHTLSLPSLFPLMNRCTLPQPPLHCVARADPSCQYQPWSENCRDQRPPSQEAGPRRLAVPAFPDIEGNIEIGTDRTETSPSLDVAIGS